MTANGWFQIIVFLLLILAVTKPLGVFMTRVFNRERTFLDPVLRPIERLIYKLCFVDESHEMRWTEYAFAMLLFSVVSMLLLYLLQRVQGYLAVQPPEARSSSAGPRFQYGSIVHHQHQLAKLFRRDHDELSHADGGSGISQLHLGCRRHRSRDCLHSWHCPPPDEDHRQFLGGHGSGLPVGVVAALRGRSAACSCRRAWCRTSSPTTV